MHEDRPGEPRPEPGPPVTSEPAREPVRQAKPSGWEAAERKRRNAMIVRLVVGLILLVLFVIFVSLNSHSVRVHFVFTETTTPLVWVFLICFLVGGLVAFLLGRSGRRSSPCCF
jgi:uncharacterized integral membrane protein